MMPGGLYEMLQQYLQGQPGAPAGPGPAPQLGADPAQAAPQLEQLLQQLPPEAMNALASGVPLPEVLKMVLPGGF
jgi:hypothetical protein